MLTVHREYAVSYESEYEPYILCRRDIPPFDERFVGYGGDKTSHAYELSRSGYVFVVLPGAFAVHAPHTKVRLRSLMLSYAVCKHLHRQSGDNLRVSTSECVQFSFS